MNEDKNKLLEQIQTRYNNSNKTFSLLLPFSPAHQCLLNNFSRFFAAKMSYKIEDKVKEILKQMGFDVGSNNEEEKYDWKKYLNLNDEDDEEDEDYSYEDEEEEEEEDDDEEEEEDDEEENENEENINESENSDKIQNKIGNLKEEEKKILTKLKILYKKYLDIWKTSNDECTYYLIFFDKLEENYKKYYFIKGVKTVYDKVTLDVIIKLNNNYQKNEIEFINIINDLLDLKNKLK